MTNNSVPTLESCVHCYQNQAGLNMNTDAPNWKTKEAWVMFALLHAEYENSKRLSLPRRYKDLERIINMFTSEPVLDKMRWMSEEEDDIKDESTEGVSDSPDSGNDFEDSSDSDDNEDSLTDSAISDNFVSTLERFMSNLKSVFSSSTITSSQTFTSSSDSSCCLCPGNASVFSASANNNDINKDNNTNGKVVSNCISNFHSAPTSPVFKSYPNSWFQDVDNIAATTDNYTNNKANNTETCFARHHSQNTIPSDIENNNKQKKDTYSHRRTEFDKCIIKRDEIPNFKIPSLRNSNSKGEKLDGLIPALYKPKTSNTMHTPERERKVSKLSKFRTSSSSPDIHGTKRTSFDRQSFVSTKGMFKKLRFNIRNNSKSNSISSSCVFEFGAADNFGSDLGKDFDIREASCYLVKMKQKFEELSAWNKVKRYMKMKKMLKSAGNLSFYSLD